MGIESENRILSITVNLIFNGTIWTISAMTLKIKMAAIVGDSRGDFVQRAYGGVSVSL